MEFIEQIKNRAKINLKTIILPESNDVRILKATELILKEKIANIILIGNEEKIKEDALLNSINIEGARIVEPLKYKKTDEYIYLLYELRKEKGMTIEEAKDLVLNNPIYFAAMMVKNNDADGYVSGANHTTADTLRPALQIIKGAEGVNTVSAFFVMTLPDNSFGEKGVFIYSDCGLNENPTSDQLADIAISSEKSFRDFVNPEGKAKIAMLSYSTFGSAHSELTEKVALATKIVKQRKPEILVDGEMQLDAAIIPEVAKLKAPDSKVAGNANVLIFPDLNSGNIAYKLTQRLAHAHAYGPLCQGMAKPVNDLSRGCSAEDIVGIVAITCIQAQNK